MRNGFSGQFNGSSDVLNQSCVDCMLNLGGGGKLK
jgi:hypothetical protein